jgi:hypothetical protein
MESMHASEGDPTTRPLVLVTVVGALVFVVILLFLQAYYDSARSREEQAKYAQQAAELNALVAEQRAQIEEYRVIDPATGQVAIPIERAMELTVEEHAEAGRNP